MASGKRQQMRVGDEEGESSGSSRSTPGSLLRPISPPAKRRRLSGQTPEMFKSPFQLTTIESLASEMNKDAISLKDILGDPLISECWEFNYLHDIEFLMSAFDDDTRHLVKVHVVHGFWRQDDPNRRALIVGCFLFQCANARVSQLSAMFILNMFFTLNSRIWPGSKNM
jgi:hypothetical protein